MIDCFLTVAIPPIMKEGEEEFEDLEEADLEDLGPRIAELFLTMKNKIKNKFKKKLMKRR